MNRFFLLIILLGVLAYSLFRTGVYRELPSMLTMNNARHTVQKIRKDIMAFQAGSSSGKGVFRSSTAGDPMLGQPDAVAYHHPGKVRYGRDRNDEKLIKRIVGRKFVRWEAYAALHERDLLRTGLIAVPAAVLLLALLYFLRFLAVYESIARLLQNAGGIYLVAAAVLGCAVSLAYRINLWQFVYYLPLWMPAGLYVSGAYGIYTLRRDPSIMNSAFMIVLLAVLSAGIALGRNFIPLW